MRSLDCRRVSRARRVPVPVALAAGVLALALFLALTTAIRMPVLVSFDESVYKLSAARYAADGPFAVFDDDVARGVAWLYSLLIAPVFALFPGDVAVRVARGLGPLSFALAAVPVFLLARRVMTPGRALAAALLSIAVPWATISTVLFSEALAYPLFALTAWAMARGLREPSPGRDALVVALCAALVLTRIQFIAVPVAWLALLLVLHVRPRREAARSFPVTLGLAALAVLVLLGAFVAGKGPALIDAIGGPYTSERERLPVDVGQATLFEVAMLALGTGLVPLVLALPGWRDALRQGRESEAFRITVLSFALIAAVFGVALLGQNGWQGRDVAEERYYIYAVPLLFVAALAALELPVLRTATLVKGGLLVIGLLALAPTTAGLSSERAFLVPVAATSANVAERVNGWVADRLSMDAGTGERDLLVLLALVVLGLALLGFRRARWQALVPAVLLQLAFAGYALAAMHGGVPGVPGVTSGPAFERLAWVDRTTRGNPEVTILADATTSRLSDDIPIAFWNDEALRTTRFPGAVDAFHPYPVSALPYEELQVGEDLAVAPAPATRTALVTPDPPFVQLAGERAGAGRGRALVRLASPARALWVARGVGADGGLPRPAELTAAPGQRVELVLLAPAGTPGGEVEVTLGDQSEDTFVDPAETTSLELDTCGAGGPVRGTLRQTEPAEGGTATLAAVRLRPC